MSKLTESPFWEDAAERAIATFFQTLLAVIGVNFAFYDGEAWREVLAAAIIAALLSFAKSVVATQVGDPNTAALLPAKKPDTSE